VSLSLMLLLLLLLLLSALSAVSVLKMSVMSGLAVLVMVLFAVLLVARLARATVLFLLVGTVSLMMLGAGRRREAGKGKESDVEISSMETGGNAKCGEVRLAEGQKEMYCRVEKPKDGVSANGGEVVECRSGDGG